MPGFLVRPTTHHQGHVFAAGEFQTPTADECYNPDGIVQRSIRLLKDKFPDLVRTEHFRVCSR